MFDQYMKDIAKEPKRELVQIKLFDNPAYNTLVLEEKLRSLDSLEDREVYSLLRDGYESILSTIFIDKNRQYLDLFTNSRFVSILIQVMSSITNISHINRTYINKIVYDYIVLQDSDPYIKQLLYSLSKTVNKDILPRLLGLGLPEDIAIRLALSRFSSQKEIVNVKRVNFIIMTSPIEIMTEQMIVFIYEKLYDRFTPLFVGTMIDNCKSDMEGDMDEIYSIISLAILDILNVMPSNDIRKVLISYVGDFQALYSKNGYRFSLQCLSNDYARINAVVDALKYENIYVP